MEQAPEMSDVLAFMKKISLPKERCCDICEIGDAVQSSGSNQVNIDHLLSSLVKTNILKRKVSPEEDQLQTSASTEGTKAKKQRTVTCPERGGTRFKAFSPTINLSTLNLIKGHCDKCLNDSLTSVQSTSKAVTCILQNTCDQCGIRWSDLSGEYSKQKHQDYHVLQRVKRLSSEQKIGRNLDNSDDYDSFRLYYEDNLGNKKKPFKSFSELPQPLKKLYLGIKKQTERDLISALPPKKARQKCMLSETTETEWCISKGHKKFLSSVITEESDFFQLKRAIKIANSNHVVYQVSPEVTCPDWGSTTFNCYKCHDQLTINFTEDAPVFIDSVLCSCGHAEEDGDKPTGTVVSEDGKNFVWVETVFFSTFVIHKNCCDGR